MNVINLTMKEYFTRYKVTKTSTENEDEDNVYTGQLDPGRNLRINYSETIYIQELGFEIPLYTRDSHNYVFTARRKLPLSRVHEQNVQKGDSLYYQLVILNHPSLDFEAERGDLSWRGFRNKFSDDFINDILEQENILERQVHQTRPDDNEDHMLREYITSATEEQLVIFNFICDAP